MDDRTVRTQLAIFIKMNDAKWASMHTHIRSDIVDAAQARYVALMGA